MARLTTMTIGYDDIAEDYARYRVCDSGVVEKLTLKSGISSSSKILEIGCGTGNYVAELQQRVGCLCWGVDPSQEMIRRAEAHNGRVRFSLGSAEDLEFEEDFFDFIFSVDVIHHVVHRAAYFCQAHRILKPQGLLATATDSEDTIRRRMPLSLYFPETIRHELERYPTSADLRRFAGNAGFEFIAEEIAETPFTLYSAEKYEKKAFSCLRLISETAFAVGIARMKQDLERGPISCVSRNYVVWNRKPAGPRGCRNKYHNGASPVRSTVALNVDTRMNR